MATVQIKLASVDITAHVVFATATFTSAVNGTVGSCKFRVRDDDRTMSPNAGDEIELIIDGDPVWTGYLVLTSRVYAFPAENVADAGLARWFDVEGSDLNTLFNKRIAFNQTTPTDNVVRFPYPPVTADSTAIAELVTNWLDLSGDSLDTSTHVETVADINVDQDAYPWSGSQTFGQAMFQIASLPTGVYFLDPSRNLVYTDVNTADAPFALSDQPTGTDAGYREMTLTSDGTSLVNDELAWGIGYGSQNPVFKRETDAASVALHGLWQDGRQANFVYKQATIDRIAQSVVYGSPSSQRGAKDDRVAVVVTTYVPGFLPAQKVDFTSNIFGFSDVIPIRKMEVTFDAPDAPKYVLTLSHAIDSPWGFVDQYLLTLPKLPQIVLPGLVLPQLCWLGDIVVDDWGRVLAGSAGCASSGYPWTTTIIAVGQTAVSVDATHLIITESVPTPGTDASASVDIDLPLDPRHMVMTVPLSAIVATPTAGTNLVTINISAIRLAYPGGAPVGDVIPAFVLTNIIRSDHTYSPSVPATKITLGSTEFDWTTEQAIADVLLTVTVTDTTVTADFLGQTLTQSWTPDATDYRQTYLGLEISVATTHDPTDANPANDLGEAGTITISSDLGNCLALATCATPTPGTGPSTIVVACGTGNFVSENPAVDTPTIVYRTMCSYQPGSLRVWLNGLLQIVTTNYAETDPSNGLFTFTSALGAIDTVFVEYRSTGSVT